MINKISELPAILNYNGNELFIDNYSVKELPGNLEHQYFVIQ